MPVWVTMQIENPKENYAKQYVLLWSVFVGGFLWDVDYLKSKGKLGFFFNPKEIERIDAIGDEVYELLARAKLEFLLKGETNPNSPFFNMN